MNVYTYNEVVSLTPESNNTFINKRVFKIVECKPPVIPLDFSGLWNYNLCSQDKCYCQPFVKGDILYMQYIIQDPTIISFYPVLVKGSTDVVFYGAENSLTWEASSDDQGTRYMNIFIDTNLIDESCFYVKLNLYKQQVDYGDLVACMDSITHAGQTQPQKLYECFAELVEPENITQIYSEPWCKVKCEDTILIKGYYPGYDCNGNYYGKFINDGTNSFIPQLRIRGEVVQQNFTFTKTTLNNKIKSSIQLRNYLFRTHEKVPPFVVEQLATCFNSKTLTIDGLEYTKGSELAKNNEEGMMWIISSTISRECDEIDFTCE